MIIIGIDPGVTTGYCEVDTDARSVRARQFSEAETVAGVLTETILSKIGKLSEIIVVIEDFVGSGPRDVYIIGTLELLGFVYLQCRVFGVKVVLRPPQWRRAFLADAERRFPAYKHRHCKDAYAHILSYLVTERGDLLGTDSARTIDDLLSGGSCQCDPQIGGAATALSG